MKVVAALWILVKVLMALAASKLCAQEGYVVVGAVIFLGAVIYIIWEVAKSTKDQPFHLLP